MDNYYIIRQSLRQIKEDLPASYYRQLPRLTKGPSKDSPRIYAVACAILSFQNLLLKPIDLQTILIQYQERVFLTMGELWALPTFLRYNLIESLAQILVATIQPHDPPDLPESFSDLTKNISTLSSTENESEEIGKNDIVANIILSLRTIAELDWSEFFESVSRLEHTLRMDPSGIYPRMDFKTRDMYRKEIESISFTTGFKECELAEIIIELARSNPAENLTIFPKQAGNNSKEIDGTTLNSIEESSFTARRQATRHFTHIGEYLLGKKRGVLEERIGYKPNLKTSMKRWILRHASKVYFLGILLLSFIILITFFLVTRLPKILSVFPLTIGGSPWDVLQYSAGIPLLSIAVFLIAITILIPMLTIATSLVNWLITLKLPPRILPKLNFKNEIPRNFQTLVVIPTIISNHEEIESLANQLELHYLRNPERGLLFAILSDFSDADSENLSEDADLVQYATSLIDQLNIKYNRNTVNLDDSPDTNNAQDVSKFQENDKIFYFLHRKRLWNPSEGKWISWERKRGKLHELNQLLRGGEDLSFINLSEDMRASKSPLRSVRYVITLDTDTILPRGAARRLAGTLAHPLNRAVFDDKTKKVISGYTILQPRVEIHPKSANLSWFTRLFAGDAGLDLYTLAVSDAYQDLFGEGIYVGKGIYDVDAFERSVANRIPENAILSHDLLEGLMGRAGLVSDITMIEDYPQNYFLQVIRQRRWIRGDWQLLPWLLKPKKFGLIFSFIDKWKMADNLRRAMLAPVLLLIFILGIIFLPGLVGLWTAIILISLGIPVLTGIARGTMQILDGEIPKVALRPVGWNIIRWLLAISFLPYEAYTATDAIFSTLFRLFISHKHLLQWTTAAQTTRMFGLQARRKDAWQKMGASTILSLFLIAIVQLTSDLTELGVAPALLVASPVLLLWILSPSLVWWINRPISKKSGHLNHEEIDLLRRVTRRTWGFFERFVGPEDHWLPPDHYQESPVGTVAHHTSPTNIGLLFTSTLAAYDLGYLDQLGLATRLTTTIDSLERLERFRGHFLNWYDTLTLQPLHPRYISTVDSGNLAASLIITTQACKSMPDEPIFRWGLWQGYLDTLSNLSEILEDMHKAEFTQQVAEINKRIDAMHAEILSVRPERERWYPLFLKAIGPFWQLLSNDLMKLVEVGKSAFDLQMLEKLQEVTSQVERHHNALLRTINELVPWIPLLENIPDCFNQSKFSEAMADLKANLPYNLTPGQIHKQLQGAVPHIKTLSTLLAEDGPNQDKSEKDLQSNKNENEKTPDEWLRALSQALELSIKNSDLLLNKFEQIMTCSEQFVDEMDFRFLYQLQRRVFHIGYNPETGLLDQNYYDLLASEARIASIVAIAKRDVPQSHWLQLGRPVRSIEDAYVLLSWSGTMFEYVMPSLFLRSYPGTLLADSVQGAVGHQIAYGKLKGVPWGISESGFYRFDGNQNYQYRAFGVPGLGFKRGLGDDLVIAPYASLMAVAYDPPAVVRNLIDLVKYKMIGLYGAYELIDFTSDRLLFDQSSAIISEYMVHHQGMILMAMDNFFHDDIMVTRMHNDPRIQSIDLLLQEQIPQSVPPQDPYAEDVKGTQRIAPAPIEIVPWSVPVRTPIPQVHLLSNGNFNVLVSNMGSGYSSWRDTDLTRWRPDGVLDPWGSWIYIQEIDHKTPQNNRLWSAGQQPVPGNMANMQVTYFAHKAVFRRIENDIASTMEVTVASDYPVEIRRIHLQNNNNHACMLRLTSYGEVILPTRQMIPVTRLSINFLLKVNLFRN